ncbi:MAG: NAD(P)-dependent alcohol dehydrogenase [Ectothiorhodospiraceae bacterium]|nr:NAD(P)-dependent alcohol dehydrogenase [Ectothiorhodospiraceae bacterium]
MRAAVWTGYGGPEVVEVRKVDVPEPRDREILVRVRAAGVSAGDTEIRSLKIPLGLGLPMRFYAGLIKPKRISILGSELSGDVEAVGKDVTQFVPGDAVIASTSTNFGGHAEYICLPEAGVIAKKPENIGYREAAVVPMGGINALHFMELAKIEPGQHVMIYGGSGSIGSFAIQLAVKYGATVHAVGGPGSLDILRSIGASEVYDYTKHDFTANGVIYDVIFDAVGKLPFSKAMKALKEDGTFLDANPTWGKIFRGKAVSVFSNKKVLYNLADESPDELRRLCSFIEEGTVTPVIDRTYTLEEIQEAHRYVEQRQKIGNVVINMEATA